MTEHGRPADPGFRDSFRAGEGENRAKEMPGARGVRGYRLKRASGWWFNVDEIGRFATLKIADLILETDGLSPRASDQIKEVRGREGGTGTVRQTLHQVGLQPFL